MNKPFLLKSSKIFCLLICFVFFFVDVTVNAAVVVPSEEKCAANSVYSPFALEFAPDALLLGAGTAFAITGHVRTRSKSFDEWYEKSYDKNDINGFDRLWYNPYSSSLDTIGTITCAVNLAVLPIGVFAFESAMGNFYSREWFTVGTMLVESWLFTYGIKNMIKTTVQRTRPYMYTDTVDKHSLDNHDYTFSFPSGHSSDAFMGAAFLSYVFCQYYPDSKYKIPVIATSYAFALGTGLLRVASGNHFMTDVAGGAVLGTVIGFGIPFIHHRLALNKYGRNSFSVSPNGFSAKFYF
ncbi:MAG: phosphatase PAP2 family protein [Treponema sp.]|nr:phosphatase PAP2 family protein [Treponema sp.]